MSGGSGGSVSVSKSKSKSRSGTYFPGQFLNAFENRYGRGVSTDELMGMLPRTQSIFGGGDVGYGYTGGQAGQSGASAQGGGTLPNGQPYPQTPSGRYTIDNIVSATNQYYQDRPKLAGDVGARVRRAAERAGYDTSQGLTMEQLQSLPGMGSYIKNELPGLLGAGSQSNGPRYAPLPGGPDVGALKIPQRINELFGAEAQKNLQGYNQWSAIPNVNAPVAATEQMNIAPQGYDAYQQAIYRSMVDPTQRTLTQQGAEDDRQLQAELAQAGIASSGTGVGQIAQQRRQRSEQLRSTAQEASYQAAQQRFGAQFAQEQFNAQQRQTANLENAGFNLDAQKANATNILTGDTLKSDAYLKTLGLNVDRANSLRTDFLTLMGITQKEMERLDQSQMDKLGVFLNNWLQQGALMGNLGQGSKSSASSSAVGVSGYAGGSMSGGS